MKKYLFRFILILLVVIAILLIFVELNKEETFTIVEIEAETSVFIKSNKLLNPSYKRATIDLQEVQIVNESGDEITIAELKIGDKINADFKPLALLSDPPSLGVRKVTLLD